MSSSLIEFSSNNFFFSSSFTLRTHKKIVRNKSPGIYRPPPTGAAHSQGEQNSIALTHGQPLGHHRRERYPGMLEKYGDCHPRKRFPFNLLKDTEQKQEFPENRLSQNRDANLTSFWES